MIIPPAVLRRLIQADASAAAAATTAAAAATTARAAAAVAQQAAQDRSDLMTVVLSMLSVPDGVEYSIDYATGEVTVREPRGGDAADS